MKKGLAGCLIVVLLALVVGGAALFWFVLRPAWTAGSALVDTAQQWQQVAKLEEQVRNRDVFQPSTEGRLTPTQVENLVAVQQAIAGQLGDRWVQLDQKYKALQAELKADGREPGVQDMFVAYQDLSAVIVEAKKAQVDALNARGLSLAEYRWVRAQSYPALGLAAMEQVPENLSDTAMAANAELLRPHRELLARTAATTWLGF